LGVKKSTNLAGIYGELGRWPLIVNRKVSFIQYWAKLIGNHGTLQHQIYMILRRDLDNNHHYNKANWAYHVKHTLDEQGMSDVWINQDYISIPLFSIKQRLIDQYVQSWYFAIDTSSKLSYCTIFKTKFCYEDYLSKITDSNLRKTLTRFRLSSHKLTIETGRYNNTRIKKMHVV
jgi:hypothetical protein